MNEIAFELSPKIGGIFSVNREEELSHSSKKEQDEKCMNEEQQVFCFVTSIYQGLAIGYTGNIDIITLHSRELCKDFAYKLM